MKRFIYGIDSYKIIGPTLVTPNDWKISPEVYKEREKKYQDYIDGKIDKYFRDTSTDPREVDISKFPPITIDEKGFVSDGNHRAFLAQKQNQPLKAFKFIADKNTHPNVEKINNIIHTIQEGLNKKEYTIYSDMDGVLVDFNNRFKRFSGGIHPADYEDKYGKEKFWDLIDNETGVRFWVGMPWMSDGKQLWNYIKNYNPTILSSPSRSNSSRMGKRIWRKRNLPSTKLVLAQAAKKQNYATPNSILIDDYESNIDQWVKAGGIGILHTDTASTINKLKELGL
jgi:hypothetical protein